MFLALRAATAVLGALGALGAFIAALPPHADAREPVQDGPTGAPARAHVIVTTIEAREASGADEFHGKVPWFEGTYAQALARARTNDSLVLLDFWAGWCRPCRRMGKTTFSDATVVAELCGVVCVSVDTESNSGKVLCERFGVKKLPTLVWLSPDGELRDVVTGFHGPDEFRRELARIRADRDTLAALERRVLANTEDLDARWRLARKLRDLGDTKGAQYQLRAIAELDREQKSLPMRLAKLEALLTRSYATFDERAHGYDLGGLEAFLAGETEPQVLFEGWFAHARMQGVHVEELRRRKAPKDELRTAALAQLATYRERAWPHRYPERTAHAANEIAWSHWEAAEFLDDDAKRFALGVAELAAAAEPDQAAILDTLACCRWMNGDHDRARELVERCIALEPKNPEWKARRAAFAR
ncbi:MAG: thioredoxin family protein [Planctomycetes bacterium]|nr:thioredoxin family protein [Planctomycetota bacterium]